MLVLSLFLSFSVYFVCSFLFVFFFFLFVALTYYFSYHTPIPRSTGPVHSPTYTFGTLFSSFFVLYIYITRTLYIITLIRRSKNPPTNKHKVAGNLLFFYRFSFLFFLSYPTKTKHQHFKTPNKTFFFLSQNQFFYFFISWRDGSTALGPVLA